MILLFVHKSCSILSLFPSTAPYISVQARITVNHANRAQHSHEYHANCQQLISPLSSSPSLSFGLSFLRVSSIFLAN